MYEKRMYGKREPGKGGRRTLGLEFLLPAHYPHTRRGGSCIITHTAVSSGNDVFTRTPEIAPPPRTHNILSIPVAPAPARAPVLCAPSA